MELQEEVGPLSLETLQQLARDKLKTLEARELKRELEITDRYSTARARRNGSELISFACNDYLGLSVHPEVIETSMEATRRYGTGAGASRLITGNHPLYQKLEEQLARLKATEDAVVFGSGYLTNVGVIPSLVGHDDLILVDELGHACLHAGATLAHSRLMRFKHNDPTHAGELLESHRNEHRYCLLLTEGVFSMDGDLAPLTALNKVAERFDAWLMSDDAHGLGVVGGGRGSSFVNEDVVPLPLQMGTLSKAVGAYGGYLSTNRDVADLIRNRARSFIYTTGLPPGTVAAATKALEIIEADPALASVPIERARLFARELGLPPAESAIVPVVLHTPERALKASQSLEQQGFLVTAIRPPTVPEGTARLRCTFSATHREEDVLQLARALRPFLESR